MIPAEDIPRKIMELLLENGADINVGDNNFEAPLHIAVGKCMSFILVAKGKWIFCEVVRWI